MLLDVRFVPNDDFDQPGQHLIREVMHLLPKFQFPWVKALANLPKIAQGRKR